MAVLTYTFFIIAMLLYMTPFIFWFLSKLAITKGRHTWHMTRRTNRSFMICIPVATLFMAIGIIINFV